VSQDKEKITSPDDTTRIVEQDPSSASHSPQSAPEPSPPAVHPTDRSRKSSRADCGKLHRTRHGIMSREALKVLLQMGEDRRTLRRLENQYRAALRPTGPLGNLLFDRFWSSYLRLLLIGRLETGLTKGKSTDKRELTASALVPGPQPTFVRQDSSGQRSETTPLMEELRPDLLRDLAVVQRYDGHFSREMYRALGLLLLLRRGGEEALEDWAAEVTGGGRPRQEG
jgi:hypothetical protein